MSKTTVRKFESDDLDRVRRVLAAVLDDEQEADRRIGSWDWLINKHPFTPETGPNAYVLEVDGEVIGFVYFLPTRVRLEKDTVPLNWVIMIMTHPKRRGAGYRLMRFAAWEMKETNFGFPFTSIVRAYARAAKGGLLRLAYPVDRVFLWRAGRVLATRKPSFKPISPIASLVWHVMNAIWRPLFWPRPDPSINIERITAFGEEFSDFWERMASAYGAICIRDRKFLTWRFIDIPHKEYNILSARKDGALLGYLVFGTAFERGLKTGYLVDFLVPPHGAKVFSRLVRHALDSLLAENVDIVKATSAPSMKMHRSVLMRFGFFFTSKTNQLVGVTFREAEIAQGIADGEAWYFTRGDSDMDIY